MREIVTLQFGHYANFVGTHYWNLQEAQLEQDLTRTLVPPESPAFDASTVFRSHVVDRTEIATPRALMFDLEGSLGAMSRHGTLSNHPKASHGVWSGKVEEHVSEPADRNRFLQELDDPGQASEEDVALSLDDSVSVWSDFATCHIHDRSIYLLKPHHAVDRFDAHAHGLDVMSGSEAVADAMDSIMYFAEECDSLQGFQYFVDAGSGGGGVASALFPYIVDEFPKISMLAFGITPPSQSTSSLHHLGSAMVANTFMSNGALYVPLNDGTPRADLFPRLSPKAQLPFHTSALLATGITAITSPILLPVHSSRSLNEMLLVAASSPRLSMAALGFTLPYTFNPSAPLTQAPWRAWTAESLGYNMEDLRLPHGEWIVSRGAGWDGVVPQPGEPVRGVSDDYRTAWDAYVRSAGPAIARSSVLVSEPIWLPVPYPQFFLNHDGSGLDLKTQCLSVASRLHTGPAVGAIIETMNKNVRQVMRRPCSGEEKALLPEKEDIEALIGSLSASDYGGELI